MMMMMQRRPLSIVTVLELSMQFAHGDGVELMKAACMLSLFPRLHSLQIWVSLVRKRISLEILYHRRMVQHDHIYMHAYTPPRQDHIYTISLRDTYV